MGIGRFDHNKTGFAIGSSVKIYGDGGTATSQFGFNVGSDSSQSNNTSSSSQNENSSNSGSDASGGEGECKGCPSVDNYKNGAEISVDGKSYILHDNKWLRVESKAQYENRISNRSYSRKPPMPRTATEKMQYEGKLTNKAGIMGAVGLSSTASILEKVLTGFMKFNPIALFSGYIGESFDAYTDMLDRMAVHDSRVNQNLNKKLKE